jgi:hypothetical protein
MADQAPLPLLTAWASVGRCVVATAGLLAARRVHQPRTHVGQWLRFGDGSAAYVYRETVIDRPTPSGPTVPMVGFRLRAVSGRAMPCSAPEPAQHPVLRWVSRLRLQAVAG